MTAHEKNRQSAEARFLALSVKDQQDVMENHPEYFARGLLSVPVNYFRSLPLFEQECGNVDFVNASESSV